MTKEHLIERYGTLRYTIGTGCSGGSLAQQWIANAYPGVYQGILPTCSFPDAWSTATQFLDYHLSLAYFDDPSKWGAGVTWTAQQMADVQGHVSIAQLPGQRRGAVPRRRPDRPLRGDHRPGAATTRPPTPAACGARSRTRRSTCSARACAPSGARRRSRSAAASPACPTDNVGVQYGLGALRSGKITPPSSSTSTRRSAASTPTPRPSRTASTADRPALANAYRSGMINETNNLDRTAIIDCRGPDEGLFHDAYRAFAVRARLDREHGGHGNQLIWEGPTSHHRRPAVRAATASWRWTAGSTAVESDHSRRPLEQKIARDKPADLTDRCYDGKGVKVSDALCPSVVHVYGTPRTVAGDAITTDNNKCRLKPLDRARLRRRQLHGRPVGRSSRRPSRTASATSPSAASTSSRRSPGRPTRTPAAG